MRHITTLAALTTVAATAFAIPIAAANNALLMGDGQLAVVYADSERADLANIDTAVYEDGTLYFDHHIRMRELVGDPPQRELVTREIVDCRGWLSGRTSWQGANFHTGDKGGVIPLSADVEMTPLNRASFQADLCRRLIAGTPPREALTHGHNETLAQFPRFALAIPDGLRPAKVENGEIVEMEETELLQHLRRVNSDF